MFFCGHGGMANYNFLYLNEQAKQHRLYRLEDKLRVLSKMTRNFAVLSYWDCCRETITPEILHPVKENLKDADKKHPL